MKNLLNQVAIVTGASSGIGRAIANQLATEGAIVCLLGRRSDALEALAGEIHADGGKAFTYPIDLTRDDDVAQFKQNIEHRFQHVDIVIHSAGVIALGEMKRATIADLDWQYQTNVRAPYALTQALLPLLVPRQSQIVFINSTAGLSSKGGLGQYAATKHALRAIADSVRQEVNADGIRVLSVYPGRTATPMQASVFAVENRPYQPETLLQPETVAHTVIHALSLPRSAEVTDINIRGTVNMSRS